MHRALARAAKIVSYLRGLVEVAHQRSQKTALLHDENYVAN
jgi:hypothetical protein